VGGHAEARGDDDVTDRTERFQAFSLPAFDLDPQERRLVRGAAVLAAAAVWLAAALIDVWFLLAVPFLATACVLAIRRLRRRPAESDDDADDWSF
jgi:hypothetical protein